jgi:hypothetical protein
MQLSFSKNGKKLNLGATFLLVVLLSGCVVADGPRHPPHPPAHFFYYWYYPYAGAYYDIDRRVYFYIVNGVWIQAIVLPPHLRPKLSHRVKIRMKLPQPYELHHEHVKKYPLPRKIDRSPPPRDVRKPVTKGRTKHPSPEGEKAINEEKRKKDEKDKRGKGRR